MPPTYLLTSLFITASLFACSSKTSSSHTSSKKFSGIWIDQFNKATGVALTKGVWYTYTDFPNEGESNILQDSIQKCYAMDEKQQQVFHFSYQLNKGDNRWDPYVVAGVALVDSQLNASKAPFMKGIAYEFKGSKHTLIFKSSLVADYAHYQKVIPESETWTTVIVPYEDFKQPVYWGKRVEFEKSTVQGIEWMVMGKTGDTGAVYIDNVRLLKSIPKDIEQ
jgi:hypothetical protein